MVFLDADDREFLRRTNENKENKGVRSSLLTKKYINIEKQHLKYSG
jgi:hypothetical protein